MNHSILPEPGRADRQATNAEAGILPPGHNCLTRRSAIKTVLASAGAAALVSPARAERESVQPDPLDRIMGRIS